MDVQFQAASYGKYNGESGNTFQVHACCVRLTQEGDDVYAQVTRMATSVRNAYVMGRDAKDTTLFPTALSNYFVQKLRPVYCYEPVTITSVYQTIWKNIQLSTVTNVAGFVTGSSAWGNNIVNSAQHFRPCTDPNDDAEMEFQFKIDANRYTYIWLRQNGADVEAKMKASVYWDPSKYPGTHSATADLVTNGVPVGVIRTIPSMACDGTYGTTNLRPLPQSLTDGAGSAGDVTIAAGATLNVTDDGALAIGGNLAGNGTLAGGGVRLTGPESCWQLTADETGFTEKVQLNVSDPGSLLADLASIRISFTGASDYFGQLTILPETELTEDWLAWTLLEVTDSADAIIRGSRLLLQEGALVATIGDPNVAVAATWTGAAGNGDLADPANWNCRNRVGTVLTNAVPMAETTVTFPAQCAFDWPEGKRFAYYEVLFPSILTLTGACDWRGMPNLEPFAAGTMIDLHGTNLTISLSANVVDKNVIFTDSTTNGGELRVSVPSGAVAQIGDANGVGPTFTGSLAFAKVGTGTLVNRVKAHSYTGRATVAEGQMWAFNNANNSSTYSGQNYFIFGKTYKANPVVIEKGATFDLRGVASMNVYNFQLNGGKLANTGYSQNWQNGWGGLGNVTLTDDSSLSVGENLSWTSGTVDLGDKTLSVTIVAGKRLYADNLLVTNGLFKIVSGGWFDLTSRRSRFLGSTLDLGCALAVNVDSTVDNLVGRFNANYASGTGMVQVVKSYQPIADYISSFEMQNGSTYDLSKATNSWPLTSSVTKQTLAFAQNARIKVALGTREVKSEDCLVAWAEPPAGVKFEPASRDFALVVKDTGLYLTRGMMVILR